MIQIELGSELFSAVYFALGTWGFFNSRFLGMRDLDDINFTSLCCNSNCPYNNSLRSCSEG